MADSNEIKNPVILFDGICNLCSGAVQFIIKHDPEHQFRFASLQSEFATKVLRRHGADPDDLDTVYVIEDYETPNERLLARSDAILHVVRGLGGFWKIAGWGKILPRPIRDALYKLVARNRYRVFGKYDTCMMPEQIGRAHV